MTITLTISDDDAEDLTNRAAQAGMSVEMFVKLSLYLMGRQVSPETVDFK